MAKLEIPDRMRLAALDAYNAHDDKAYGVAAAIIVTSQIAVATKLRQLADDWDAGHPVTCARLRAEADDLEGKRQ